MDEEKDLGVIISKDLKAENNVIHCVKKANKILGMTKRTFSFLDKEMLVLLYKVFVRPHLEYNQQACSPYLIKDITLLEGVQRRATKLIKSLAEMPYEERLKELNLYSLQERRMRRDQILMFRIMTGDVKINKSKLFTPMKISSTRGNSMKVNTGKICHLNLRQQFFTERVIVPWNSLPEHVVKSTNVEQFKTNYDKWHGLVA